MLLTELERHDGTSVFASSCFTGSLEEAKGCTLGLLGSLGSPRDLALRA